MLRKVDILLMMCMLLACVTYAQERENSTLAVNDRGDGTIEAAFSLGAWHLSATATGEYGIEAEGMCADCGTVGQPALPTMSTIVALPVGSTLAIKHISIGAEQRHQLPGGESRLRATAGPSLKEDTPIDYFIDEGLYTLDTFFRDGDEASLEPLGVMGGQRLYRLRVRPFAYNPARGLVGSTAAIDITLTVDKPATAATDGGHEAKATADGNRRYLVVSRSEFREGLQPFVRWKRQEGYLVEELYVETNLRDSVKAQIAPHFTPTAPEYLLIVGDAAQIQSFIGTTHPTGIDLHVTDLYYAEHTGDYLPDALWGRWPVNDTAELRAVVEKTLRYEQCIDLDTTRLKRVLTVAGMENSNPAPVTTNGQVNYVAREGKQNNPAIDTIVYRNPASGGQRAEILNDLRQGASILNYTAHCTTAGWTSPAVSFTSIDTLGLEQPLLYINNCCKSNEFAGTGFGEQLLRKPVGGAVGVIGATNSTLWNEDYYWAVGPKHPFSLEPEYDGSRPGAFDHLWRSGADGISAGELLVRGNMAVAAFGSPYDKFYWEIYCLLGDPSLKPYIGVPKAAYLATSETPLAGQTEMHLLVSGATTVTVMQGDSVTGIWHTDVAAEEPQPITVPLDCSIDTGHLVVTATAYMHQPAILALDIEATTGGIGLYDVTVGDSSVNLTVANLGPETIAALDVEMSQSSDETAAGAVIEAGSTTIENLLPGSRESIVLPYSISVLGQQPLWHATLTASDGTNSTALHLSHTVTYTYPTANFRLLDTDTALTYRLRPQRSYLLETSIEGLLDSMEVCVTALPTGETLASLHTTLHTIHLPLFTPDTLTHLRINATLHAGNYSRDLVYYLVAGARGEGFEQQSYPWQTGGTIGWRIDSSMCHSGGYSMRTGAIGPRQISDLMISVLLADFDTVSFWIKTSTEPQYDKVVFSVDGVDRVPTLFGEYGWTKHTYLLRPGRHTLRWRYIKDEETDGGSDCAWIDDLTMPLALWDSAYGWFPPEPVAITPQPQAAVTIAAYPNPTQGKVTIDGIEGLAEIRITDIYGRTLTATSMAMPAVVDLSDLADGVYMLQCSYGKSVHNTKIVKKH